jgi:predicted TIM-barrel fold metal-dependent hydrolase
MLPDGEEGVLVTRTAAATSGGLRTRIGHPVIDADGHTVEVTPVLNDFIQDVGGKGAVTRFGQMKMGPKQPTLAERRENCTVPSHWVWPAKNTLDRATAALPRLYYERLDEIGLDFSLVYPTIALHLQLIGDDELRQVLCRAVNLYMAELHKDLADRLLPVAAIPMHSPEEALDELEFAVRGLGMRAILIPSFVCRPIPAIHRTNPEYDQLAVRFDTYGLDSEYDYDPVWAKCVELKVVPSVHTATQGYGFRRSASNYVYNHIGSFAASCEALCKSLIMGGVFHRFPTLRIAALEGGVGWAATLYADFLSHWAKRNGNVIGDLDPARLDVALLASLLEDYGSERIRARVPEVLDSLLHYRGELDNRDEFSACPFDSPEEFRDLFVSHIYIGCEADDRLNALAFNSELNPLDARFRVMFGSDISHWDVPDVANVLHEAFELVEDGLITEEDFREFSFSNAARLYAGTNPDFFQGTRVAEAVGDLVRSERVGRPKPGVEEYI